MFFEREKSATGSALTDEHEHRVNPAHAVQPSDEREARFSRKTPLQRLCSGGDKNDGCNEQLDVAVAIVELQTGPRHVIGRRKIRQVVGQFEYGAEITSGSEIWEAAAVAAAIHLT